MYDQIWITIIIVAGLGLVFGIGLSYASKKFHVKVDERIEMVRAVLPGVNCAACGQTGCDAYAQAVVEGSAEINKCIPGGSIVLSEIGRILGREADAAEVKVARVLCRGSNNECKPKFNYSGMHDCTAAVNHYGGPSSCAYSCVGYGNCAKACPFDAIHIENNLATIIIEKCTGCGMCVRTCPKKLITLVPVKNHYTVSCSSHEKGNLTRQYCTVGCIGCTRCVKACPSTAISMQENLAVIDPVKCTNCGECVKVCPTGSIHVY